MLYNYVNKKVIQNSYLTNKKEEQIYIKKQEDDYVEYRNVHLNQILHKIISENLIKSIIQL